MVPSTQLEMQIRDQAEKAARRHGAYVRDRIREKIADEGLQIDGIHTAWAAFIDSTTVFDIARTEYGYEALSQDAGKFWIFYMQKMDRLIQNEIRAQKLLHPGRTVRYTV